MSTPATYVDYTATAAQTDFAFSFDYLEDEHVTVSIDGAATTDFSIVTTPSTKIVLDTGATAGQVVRVARYSQPDQNLVDFVNGSVLTESELDRAYLHNRYLAEESAEQNDVSLRVKEGAAGWDGLNKRLLNLANPVDDQDAATKDYVDDVIGSVAVGTLPDDSVTYAKIQEVAANNVLLGNDNGTNQNVQELTAAEVRTVLNVEDGANNYSHPNHTGDVTSTGDGATVITDNAVTSAKISDSDTTFKVAASEVAVNDGGADVDFRVEGDTDANLISTNAAEDTVGIGSAGSSSFKLNVNGGTAKPNIANFQADNAGGSVAAFIRNSSATGISSILQMVANTGSNLTSRVNLDLQSDVGVNEFFQISFNTKDLSAFRFENSDNGSSSLASGAFFPASTGQQDLGKTGQRWDDVWSAGTFNGSDQNLKQDIEDLNDAEKRVAVKCKGLIKKYRMKDAVAKKGNDARIHVGIIAQELQAAFESEGLDAFRYSMIGKDTWWEKMDENGQRLVNYKETPGYTKVTQMSVRYNELLAFIISAM